MKSTLVFLTVLIVCLWMAEARYVIRKSVVVVEVENKGEIEPLPEESNEFNEFASIMGVAGSLDNEVMEMVKGCDAKYCTKFCKTTKYACFNGECICD